jgi:hypothetical protein
MVEGNVYRPGEDRASVEATRLDEKEKLTQTGSEHASVWA